MKGVGVKKKEKGTADKRVLFHEGCWAVEGFGVSWCSNSIPGGVIYDVRVGGMPLLFLVLCCVVFFFVGDSAPAPARARARWRELAVQHLTQHPKTIPRTLISRTFASV